MSREAIEESTHTTYKEQISSLIGENIQLFDDLVSVCTTTHTQENAQKQTAV